MLRSTSDPVIASANPPDRAGRKALALTDLCMLRPLPEPVLEEIDRHLTSFLQAAEARVRAQAALKLSQCDWAPLETIRVLAFDAYAVSAPVLLHSECLKEQDLLALAGLGAEQRSALAKRRVISDKLAERISQYRERGCLALLFANLGAQLTATCAEQTADIIKADAMLQSALSRRGSLELDFAQALYEAAGEAVSALLKEVCPEALDHLGEYGTADDEDKLDDLGASLTDELRKIDALNAADVLRATQNGRADISDHAVARLTGLEPADWRQALRRSPVRVSILAARAMAMNIDHAHLFFEALCEQGRAHPLPLDAAKRAVGELYQQYSRDAARQALHRMSADGSIH
ncbi:DUF2336 domain-containing protein [Oceanicaulis alexandrii]|uniref:DUF2336 domain-containing protein n=1 Tax=Oceanicaulis alexandrii TaxID=153233 RepID=UPI0003B64A08|nr:DUF2336 domain-containing protein [Oceanicaulis alexandrii]